MKLFNWVCWKCEIEFKAEKRLSLSVHCPKCGKASYVVGTWHPLARMK